ncbi:MAG: ATP-binding protein [Bacteroidota bacterium]
MIQSVIKGLLLGIMLSFSTIYALNVDSLKREIAIQVEEGRPLALIKSYEVLGRHYYAESMYEDALICYHKGLELANSLEDNKKAFFFMHYLGAMYYYPKDDYQKSLDYLLRAESLAERTGIPSEDVTQNYVKLAEVYNTKGDFEDAVRYQLEALRLAEQNKDTMNLALGARILGVIYWSQKQYKQALQNFQVSEKLHEYLLKILPADDPRARENATNYYTTLASMSVSYLSLDSLDDARPYIQRSKDLADSLNHKYGAAYSEALTGNLFEKLKQYDEALVHLNKANKMFEELHLRRERALFSIKVAEIQKNRKEMEIAHATLDEAEAIAKELESHILIRDIYKVRSEIYDEQQAIGVAYHYFKSYIQIRDSLLDEERLITLAEIETRTEVREKEQEIANLEEETANDRRLIFLIGLTIVFLFLGIFVFLVQQRNNTLKELNQVLEIKNREIQRQNERLASSNEDLRQFAHVTSHDLREPLRNIGSFASLLKRRYVGKIDSEADEFIDFIVSGVDQMDKLLSDLLAYSVVGIFQHEFEKVNINEVITLIIENLNREKATAGAKISLHDLPSIQANRKQMIQLFHHLIDNSIKFRKDESPQISIRAEKRGSYYLFSVEDNGIGMEEAYQDKIFGLFLRLHTKKSKYKGTGIGLSICKKIVEQHKGKIWIDSKLGDGTTVYFTLPKDPNSVSSEEKIPAKYRKWEKVTIS